jgi:hypothetical protein
MGVRVSGLNVVEIEEMILSKNGRDKFRTYRVKFKEIGKGRDGGFGDPKTCKMSLRDPNQAGSKLRKRAVIISVREVKY